MVVAMIKYLTGCILVIGVMTMSNAQVLPNFKKTEQPKKVTVLTSKQKNTENRSVHIPDKKVFVTNGYVKHYPIKDDVGNKAYYTGHIENGLPQGKGKSYFQNGIPIFEGTFLNGNYNTGTYYFYYDGSKLKTGTFSNNKLIAGIYYQASPPAGRKWKEGTFNENEQLQGYGKMYDDEGKLNLEGTFQDGGLNGTGKQYWEDGMYEGEFKNSRSHGKGVLKSFSHGSIWTGEFYDGGWQSGEILFKDGSKYVGRYIVYMKSANTGHTGVYYFANGDRYEGEFWRTKMQGKGTYTWKDGSSYSGTFNANQIEGNSQRPLQTPFIDLLKE